MHKLRVVFLISSLLILGISASAQDKLPEVEELKKEMREMRLDVHHVQKNLGLSKKRFQRGILVATLGYSITIAGGLMLGRKNDDLGKGLLVLGGATGITGTVLLVDAFKFLGIASKRTSQ